MMMIWYKIKSRERGGIKERIGKGVMKRRSRIL